MNNFKNFLEYTYPKMFSTDFIFRQQENIVDNQKCQAGFRPLCNKILLWIFFIRSENVLKTTHYKKLAPNALQFTYQNLKSCKPHEKQKDENARFVDEKLKTKSLMFFV